MLYHVKSPFLMIKSDEIPFLHHTSASSCPCFTGEEKWQSGRVAARARPLPPLAMPLPFDSHPPAPPS